MLISGVATSQTVPVQGSNDQLNVGDLFAGQTLNVVTVDEGVTATTTAGGNTFGATVVNADAGLTSNQVNQGAVTAHGVVNVSGSMGDSSTVTTTAVGNSGTATAAYGTLSGFMVQTNSGAVIARSQIEGDTAQAGDVIETSSAAGNSQGLLMVNGSMGAGSARTTRPTWPPTAARCCSTWPGPRSWPARRRATTST